MKLITLIICLVLSSSTFSQKGVIQCHITLTDTARPNYVRIFVNKGQQYIKNIIVDTTGTYLIRDLLEGDYNLELYSLQVENRRLNLKDIHVADDSVAKVSIIYPGPCKFIYPKDYKPVCPFNHKDSIVRIVYGFPSGKNMRKAKEGKIYLGGCIITNCDPKYYCKIHKLEL